MPLQRACEGGGEMKMHGPNLGFVILGGCRSLDCCRCCAPPAGARGRSPCHVVKRREGLGRVHGSGPVGAGGGGAAPPTPHPLLRWTAKPAPVTLLAPRLRCCTLPWQARWATWADTRVPVEAACATRRTARGGRVFGLAKEQDNPKRSARRACLPPCCAHSEQAQGGVACFARMCRLLVRYPDPSVSILAAT